MMQSVSLNQAELDVVIEARDMGHVEAIVGAVWGRGFNVRMDSGVQ